MSRPSSRIFLGLLCIEQIDSDSLLSTLLVHLVNQNHLVNIPIDNQNNEADAEQITKTY